MKNYQMIAFDLDGTLLNSKKELSPAVLRMIGRVFDAGREVILSTGRCIPELREVMRQLPQVRYTVCVSGAMVYDWKEKRLLAGSPIPVETVERILALCRPQAPMVHFLSMDSMVQRDQEADMARYGMGVYQSMFDAVTTKVEDIYSYYRENPIPLAKLNLYHATPEGRARTRERLAGLPVELADAEAGSLECSAEGVTKGTGLQRFCRLRGIPLEQVIAVGDADNDLAVLRCAGYAIAMGNASDRVKAVCDRTVSDCDHDGCAEAIVWWLNG